MLTQITFQQSLQNTDEQNENEKILLDLVKIYNSTIAITSPGKQTTNADGSITFSTASVQRSEAEIAKIYAIEAKKYISKYNNSASEYLKTEFARFNGRLNNVSSTSSIPSDLINECLYFYKTTKAKKDELTFEKYDNATIKEDISKLLKANETLRSSDATEEEKRQANNTIEGYKNPEFLRNIVEIFTMQTSDPVGQGKLYTKNEFFTTGEIASLLFFMLDIETREKWTGENKSQFIFKEPSNQKKYYSEEVVFEAVLQNYLNKLNSEKSNVLRPLKTELPKEVHSSNLKPTITPNLQQQEHSQDKSKH